MKLSNADCVAYIRVGEIVTGHPEYDDGQDIVIGPARKVALHDDGVVSITTGRNTYETTFKNECEKHRFLGYCNDKMFRVPVTEMTEQNINRVQEGEDY